MSSLNLFPARVPTGRFRGADGKDVDVYATPEFFRALSDVFTRIGGNNGIANDELALFTILAPTASVAQPEIADLDTQGAEQGAQTACLKHALEEIQFLVTAVTTLSADVKALREAQHDAEVSRSYQDQFRVNWERPGNIGSLTPGTARFTTVTASGGYSSGLATALLTTTVALNNGAAAAAGTLANAPVAGNPTKWIPVNDNGTVRYIPAW